MKYHSIFKLLLVCAMGACGFHAKAQRASEKPITAFYSSAMQEKMNAATHAQPAQGNQKRASEKPIPAVYTREMQSRQNATSHVSPARATEKRASQKPLSAFYTKAMKERVRSRVD